MLDIVNETTIEKFPHILATDIQVGDRGDFGTAVIVSIGRTYVTITNARGAVVRLLMDERTDIERPVLTKAALQARRERRAVDKLQAILDDYNSDSYAKKVEYMGDKIAEYASKPGYGSYILDHAGELTELSAARQVVAVFVDEVEQNPEATLIESARVALDRVNTYLIEQVRWARPFSRSTSVSSNLYGDVERNQLAKFSEKLQNILERVDN